MKTSEIRSQFLEFFAGHDHSVVPSSSLVPGDDPSLLFTNAGMVQFKDVFLGLDERDYRRATSSQRCVRAGGKHNDLDNVGYTARHHTFFEMLGNFSFGDYFKREAITLAWTLLTERFGLPPERLWVTVFETDDEAAKIWTDEVGVDPARLTRCGEKDNFWMMGDTGPCGPCTEIFYDHGPDVAGGPPGSPDADGDRYVEIWNLVFMQFERSADGQRRPIPKPSVDTGMGLERIAAVLQGVHNNYDIDLFRNLIAAIVDLAPDSDHPQASLRVIADHIRSCAFLVMDGVTPSNEGRGYVLRRIIRRALRHGNRVGFTEPFFHRLVAPLEREMGVAVPELAARRAQIETVLEAEEVRFAETLGQGLRIFEDAVADMSGRTIPGDLAFKLYDTYGFPVDLTADIARERGLEVDMPGFEAAMGQQRTRARAASQFSGIDTSAAIPAADVTRFVPQQAFRGYECLDTDARVLGLYQGGAAVAAVDAGQSAVVVIDETPFYAESGGQVGDHGRVVAPAGAFEVSDTRKQGGLHLLIGSVSDGRLETGASVRAEVESRRRSATVLNHSATHLMHAALREVLGTHVEQKGSLVDAERLRFDFSHGQPVTPEELRTIESIVNEQIRGNSEVEVAHMSYRDAVDGGAMALFGEKYGDEVRVLRMGGDFSVELCGGTHVGRTGDIGLFKVVAESGVASGVRRIEAVTGATAIELVQQQLSRLAEIGAELRCPVGEVPAKVHQLSDRLREQDKEIQALKANLANQSGRDLADAAVDVDGVKVLAECIDGADVQALRTAMDRLKNKLQHAAIVLATVEEGKVRLVAGVTKDLSATLPAGTLVNAVATQVGGKGGGRPDMAQAGGTDPSRLPDALAGVPEWVRQHLAAS